MSDIIHTVDRTVSIAQNLGATERIITPVSKTGHRYQEFDIFVSGTATDDYIMDIDISTLQLLMMWTVLVGSSNNSITVKFYTAGPTLDLTANVGSSSPFFYTPVSGMPSPFSADIVKLNLEGAGGGSSKDGQLYIRLLTAATLGV